MDPGRGDAPAALVLPFQGRFPRIAPGAWLAPGVTVIGDVELAEDVSLWYGTVLRGDVNSIRVGPRTNLQDLCVVHVTRDRFETVIGAEVTVGHRAVVHGCTVEEGALIGIGALVLDGAHVGEEAWVGAGAVVAPGARIPARHLALGTPARVVRELSAEERALQRERTRLYVGNARAHAASFAVAPHPGGPEDDR